MAIPESEVRSWHREVDGARYFCSTDPKHVQRDALNAALASELLWWCNPLSETGLKRLVEHSLCFGLYLERPASAEQDGEPIREMVGFARVITDHVTVGYLTDVYVLEQHQRRGLATWMMDCVNDVISDWPEMRGFLLLVSDPHVLETYEKTLGAKDIHDESPDLVLMERSGPASVRNHG